VEKDLLKVIAQLGVIGLIGYALLAVMGKGSKLYVKKHASLQKQDPTSLVWSNTTVQGPNASSNKGQLVSGYVGIVN
jgi:hypothetical protein